MATTTSTESTNKYIVTTSLQDAGGRSVGELSTTITKNVTAGSSSYGKVTMSHNLYLKTVEDGADCANHILMCSDAVDHFEAVDAVLDEIKVTGGAS